MDAINVPGDVKHVAGDVRAAYLVVDHGWELGVQRLFGVAREDQSVVVKVLLTGAVIAVVGSYVPRLRPGAPSAVDAAMGGSVLVSLVGGLAGATAAAAPAAGAVIVLALAGTSVRSALTGSSRVIRGLTHDLSVGYERLVTPPHPSTVV
jgi:hypothetical protein